MKPFSRLTLSLKGIFKAYIGIFIGTLSLLSAFTSYAQQCTLPSRIFIPSPDQDHAQGFGESIDIDGQYMIAGVPYNSALQVYAGIAFIYKLGNDNQWVKIAELMPSDPGKYEHFGREVTIAGNGIVIRCIEYNDEGNSRAKLYVYEKPASGEWTSTTESYVITKPFGSFNIPNGIGSFHLHGNELIVTAVNDGKEQLEIYEKASGVFAIKQSIDIPVSRDGRIGWYLQVTDTYITISSSEFEHSDRSNGVAFIYQKNASNYDITPVMLRSAEQTPTVHTAFGSTMAATNETLYIAGWIHDGSTYRQTFYVFQKPIGGWVSTNIPFTFKLEGYNYYTFQIAATNDYLFTSISSYKSVVGIKKPSTGWSSNPEIFIIDDLPADTYLFGEQIQLSGEHLVMGSPGRYLDAGKPSELIVDYYSPTRAWNDPSLQYHQIIQETPINATDDFFGNAMAANDTQIAIGASGDDSEGAGRGVVYIFDTQGNGSLPRQKIYSPVIENHTGFGVKLAMSDSVLFITAPYTDSLGADNKRLFSNIGKVYVYRLTQAGWQYSTQLKAPAVQSEISFGMSVACHGDYVAVTEFYTGSSESVGSVHIYKQDALKKFRYIATLTPSVRLRSDFFGQSMVMNDSLMLIGTGFGTVNSSYRMSAYVFKKKGEWKSQTEDARLTASDAGWADRFGTSVAIYDEYIVVGAPYSPGFDPRPVIRDYIIPGAAYIYKRPPGGWKGVLLETAKITPGDPTDFGNFGYRVAIDHDDIFIASPDEFWLYNYTDKFTNNDGSLHAGKVYHYKKPKNGWVSTNKEFRQIHSFEPEVMDGYGSNLFISNRYLYVAAVTDDTPSGYKTGSVQTMMQLPVIDNIALSCSDQSPVKLLGFPKGGIWTGTGVNSQFNTFSSAAAGVGEHQINYSVYACETSTTATVISEEVDVLMQSDLFQTKCINKSIPLTYKTSENPTKYMWFYRAEATNNFLKLDSSTQQIMAGKPGIYEVQVERAVCPPATTQFTVVDEATVSVDIEPLEVICSDKNIQLTATPLSGIWSGANVDLNGTITPEGVQNGVYKALYKIVTPIGCIWKDSLSYEVDILKEPLLAEHENTICKSSPVTLTLENIDSRSVFTWYDTFDNRIAGANKSFLKIQEPGTYYAHVSKYSCSFITPAVTFSAIQDTLFVPNVFTANGDHINDYFEIKGSDLNNFHLQIFNRYGKIVFETKDIDFKWSGSDAPPGVYYWKATYLNCFSNVREQKGWVHVLKNE